MTTSSAPLWAARILASARASLGGTTSAPNAVGRPLGRGRRRRTACLVAGITLVYLLITSFYMGRAITSCTTDILGYPGDATAGFTWFTWADRSSGPVPGFRGLTNAPFGESLRNPDQITAAAPMLAMWSLGQVTTPFCAWNMLVLFGYLSSALTMFGLMRWLTGSTWVGFFAGFAVGFMPYHQLNALGHASYLLNFILTLFVWAFFAFWACPTRLRAASMGAALAGCAYIDGYFILLGGVLATSAIAVAVTAEFATGDRTERPGARLKGLLIFAATAGMLLLPIAWVQYAHGTEVSAALASSRGAITAEATRYSARPYEYLMPDPGSPLLPKFYATDLYPRTPHDPHRTESALYVGLVVLLLAATAWVRLRRHHHRDERLRGLSLRFIVATVTTMMIVAFLFSLPPMTSLFGFRLPLPSFVVVHLTAAWRVFARLYLVVETCLVVVAGVGLWFVIRRMAPRRRGLVAVTAVLLVFADFLTDAGGVVWSQSRAPGVYRWLRTRKDVRLIAEYPLSEPPSLGILDYLTYQQIDGKPRFNTFRSDSPQRPLHLSMLGLADAQTLPILRAAGVQLVLSHRHRAGLAGMRLLRRDRSHDNDDDVWTYRILPGRTASYAVVAAEGFHLPVLADPLHSRIGTGTDGVLNLQLMPGARRRPQVHVTLTARAAGRAEPVTIAQGGAVRWAGTVAGPTPIAFTASTDRPIDVKPRYAAAGDTIQISDMAAAP